MLTILLVEKFLDRERERERERKEEENGTYGTEYSGSESTRQ